MITEKDTIKCESIFNDEHTHRFIWKRVWNKDKPLATVIMLNPCHADNIVTDTTSALVANNIARQEVYGGVLVVNLFSKLTSKLAFRWNSDEELNEPDNDLYIKKAADESTIVIAAWGKAVESNQRIAARADQVLALLADHTEKLFSITDGVRSGLHPLTPTIRNGWVLVPFEKTWDSDTEPNSENENDPA